jgi:para-nitrobenzyl esterase
MAFHCSEMSFAFFNSDRCENMTGGGPAARALAEKVSDAWIQFARTGDPNHAGLPQWSPVTSGTNATMVFDNECFFRNNLDDEQQQFTRGS